MDALTVHAVAQMAEARRYTAFAAELYRLAAQHAFTPQGAQVLQDKADGLTVHRWRPWRPEWWKAS